MRVRNLLWSFLLLFLPLLPAAGPSQAGGPDPQASAGGFVERFDILDRKRWYISSGWSNGPHQNCTWSQANVMVSNSAQLQLTDRRSSDRPFTCAELQSREFYSYGTYEVRMRPAANPGTVSAFFSYTGPPPSGQGREHNEIDFEFLGKTRNGVFLNYFVGGRGHEQTIKFDFDATASPNDYAFEWTPQSIRWFANGSLIREVKNTPDTPLPTQPQKIILSIWNGTGPDQEAWLGRFEYPGQPIVAAYELVAFTPMGSPCQFPTSIVCRQDGSKGESSNGESR